MLDVREYLNHELPNRWIGRVGADDQALFLWPPRSPDLTPCDFYLWEYIKDRVYVPPLPQTLVQLRERINNAVMAIDRTTLHKVWNELDYRLDILQLQMNDYRYHYMFTTFLTLKSHEGRFMANEEDRLRHGSESRGYHGLVMVILTIA
ncbi:hypothetical protein ANN_03572 [Periplaneta americana]|uniref:Uncharacterized protein n=1 Tax=Periplaneta americana TaxID=6978 RepID=A0ABQ8U2C6_PERAM|nr:hypothetical protein ANN_03572 [Periplaneta americana]